MSGVLLAGQTPPTRLPVRLVNFTAQHAQVADEVAPGWAEVIERSAFVGGPQVAEFAAFSEVTHCVAVANGTDVFELALRAVGIGPGDERVLPVNTFIATAEAVAGVGAAPVLVDCDEDTALVDVDAVAAAIGPRTRAVLPVHLYGQPAPVEPITPLAWGSGRGRGTSPGRPAVRRAGRWSW